MEGIYVGDGVLGYCSDHRIQYGPGSDSFLIRGRLVLNTTTISLYSIEKVYKTQSRVFNASMPLSDYSISASALC